MGPEEDPGLIYGTEADSFDLDGSISDEESRGC